MATRSRKSVGYSHKAGWRPRWTLAQLVRALERLHAAHVPLTYRGLEEAGHGELAHAINYCGGIRQLRRRCQLPRPVRRRRPRASTSKS
jgi:hypothetical protein